MAVAPTEIRTLARSYTKAAINTLVGIMRQPKAPPAARVAAAIHLLDRGWGKAARLVAVDGEIKQLVEVKLNVVTAGESRAIEHSSPTASSENSANQPATLQPIDIIDVDCS
jgi:hypothetical protein